MILYPNKKKSNQILDIFPPFNLFFCLFLTNFQIQIQIQRTPKIDTHTNTHGPPIRMGGVFFPCFPSIAIAIAINRLDWLCTFCLYIYAMPCLPCHMYIFFCIMHVVVIVVLWCFFLLFCLFG